MYNPAWLKYSACASKLICRYLQMLFFFIVISIFNLFLFLFISDKEIKQ